MLDSCHRALFFVSPGLTLLSSFQKCNVSEEQMLMFKLNCCIKAKLYVCVGSVG